MNLFLEPYMNALSLKPSHVLDASPHAHARGAEPERSPNVLTVTEVAADLRTSKAHICNLIAGRVRSVTPLAVIRLGRRILVRRITLEEWKRENEHAAGTLGFESRELAS
jgi:hypothetical protein